MEIGDVLCTYTDGITEATGRDGEEFGEARLLELLRAYAQHKAPAILRGIEEAVRQFREGEQEDDLTLMVARGR